MTDFISHPNGTLIDTKWNAIDICNHIDGCNDIIRSRGPRFTDPEQMADYERSVIEKEACLSATKWFNKRDARLVIESLAQDGDIFFE